MEIGSTREAGFPSGVRMFLGRKAQAMRGILNPTIVMNGTTMNKDEAAKRSKLIYLPYAVVIIMLLTLAAVGQFVRPSVTIGHDEWSLLPVREWGIMVGNNAGFWDGVKSRTHQGVGGRIYVYGCLERMTNR